MTNKVFSDLHHFDLFYSFHKLFEDRLGWELYRPIGYEWKEEGYWNVNQEDLIVKGYLSTTSRDIEQELKKYSSFENYPQWARHAIELLRIGEILKIDDIYLIEDKSKQDFWQKGITLEVFKETKFDIIISSLPWHFDLFEDLRNRYQPQAKHIFQAGNIWEQPKGCKNFLHNYHQEFDLTTFHKKRTNKPTNLIYSYVHFPESANLLEATIKHIPLYDAAFLGKTLGPRENIIIRSSELADTIRRADFVWHIKPGGEGYGHVLHNAFACGTPVITSFSDYKNKIGEQLLIDKVTAINVDNRSPYQIAELIIGMENNYSAVSNNVYNKFKEVVNFDKEFIRIKEFLDNLQ